MVRREQAGSCWYELALGAAALVSVAASAVFTAFIRQLGGFTLEPPPSVFSSVTSMAGHFWWTVQGVLALFGADFFTLRVKPSTGLVLLHLAGLALAVIAVVLGVRRFLRGDDLIANVLTASVLINVTFYMFSTVPVSIYSGREIAWVAPAGAALAGRLLAGPVIARRLGPLLGVIGLGYLVALGYGVTRPQRPAEGQNLAGWLAAHHLRYGLSGYGFGPTTTLASGGKVRLIQLTWLPRRVRPGPEEWRPGWYRASEHDATFVVAPVKPNAADPFTRGQVAAIFGPPARVYRFAGQFIIMTYDKNLLKRVS